MIAYLNGNFMAAETCTISPLDRGFLFGDSVYEVLPVYDRNIFRAHQHLDRLDYSLSHIALKNPHTHQQWNEIFAELIDRCKLSDLSIYLQVSRGYAPQREHVPPDEIKPTVFAMSSPAHRLAAYITQNGVAAVIVDDIRWQRCDIKSTNLLANVLSRMQAKSQAAYEAILVSNGMVLEGAASNVFIISDGCLMTPPLTQRLLAGITRGAVLEIAQQQAVSYLEQDFSVAQLYQADEVWLTSSTRNILPVTRIDKQTIGCGRPGPMWHQFSDAMIALSQ